MRLRVPQQPSMCSLFLVVPGGLAKLCDLARNIHCVLLRFPKSSGIFPTEVRRNGVTEIPSALYFFEKK